MPQNAETPAALLRTGVFTERMTRFELATLTWVKERLRSPSLQSVYCCAVPHSPKTVWEIGLVRIPVYHRLATRASRTCMWAQRGVAVT